MGSPPAAPPPAASNLCVVLGALRTAPSALAGPPASVVARPNAPGAARPSAVTIGSDSTFCSDGGFFPARRALSAAAAPTFPEGFAATPAVARSGCGLRVGGGGGGGGNGRASSGSLPKDSDSFRSSSSAGVGVLSRSSNRSMNDPSDANAFAARLASSMSRRSAAPSGALEPGPERGPSSPGPEAGRDPGRIIRRAPPRDPTSSR